MCQWQGKSEGALRLKWQLYLRQYATSIYQSGHGSIEVSVRQPHIRTVVQGKARGEVEFGQKLGLSIVDGFTIIEKQSWDNFSENKTLQASAERFRERHGIYPEAIIADKTYRNRETSTAAKPTAYDYRGRGWVARKRRR